MIVLSAQTLTILERSRKIVNYHASRPAEIESALRQLIISLETDVRRATGDRPSESQSFTPIQPGLTDETREPICAVPILAEGQTVLLEPGCEIGGVWVGGYLEGSGQTAEDDPCGGAVVFKISGTGVRQDIRCSWKRGHGKYCSWFEGLQKLQQAGAIQLTGTYYTRIYGPTEDANG